jgi:ubiquitin
MKKMKKSILNCVIVLSVLSLTALKPIKSTQTIKAENKDCQYGQCAKIKADGYQCRNCAQRDSYYCWSHRN